MLFKMKFVACMLALATAHYACAQETGKAGSAQNPASGSQVGKAQPATETPTEETKNRRRDQVRTDENRPAEDRKRNRRDVTNRTETRERRVGAATDSPLDVQLASCLLIGNQKEVAISQFASERSKNEKVKEFAKQMIKDHTQAITMLQRFAGPDASKDLSIESTRTNRSETTVNRSSTTVDSNRSPDSTNPANRDSSANRKSGDATKATDEPNRTPNATTRTSSDSSKVATDASARTSTNQTDREVNSVATVQVRSEQEAMPDKMLAIQREVAQKCISMAKQELEQSSNFDQAYVGMQISAHVEMISHLETYKSYASQDLGKVIQESLDTAQGHLRHAKELVTEISHDKTGSRGSATSSSETSNRNEAGGRDANSPSRREGGSKKDSPKS